MLELLLMVGGTLSDTGQSTLLCLRERKSWGYALVSTVGSVTRLAVSATTLGHRLVATSDLVTSHAITEVLAAERL